MGESKQKGENQMAKAGKVRRLLKLTIEPIGKDKFAVAFVDFTSRSTAEDRKKNERDFADSWSSEGLIEGIGLVFRDFKASLEDEDQGALFSETTSAKPKRDPKK
jgi:hypothetical protein